MENLTLEVRLEAQALFTEIWIPLIPMLVELKKKTDFRRESLCLAVLVLEVAVRTWAHEMSSDRSAESQVEYLNEAARVGPAFGEAMIRAEETYPANTEGVPSKIDLDAVTEIAVRFANLSVGKDDDEG